MPVRRPPPSNDEVIEALTYLHEHPYGQEDEDSLGMVGMRLQQRSCAVIFHAVVDRRQKSLRRLGVDEEQAKDLISDVLNQFLQKDVALVPPVPARALSWLDRVIHNAAIDFLRTAPPTVRLNANFEAMLTTEEDDADVDALDESIDYSLDDLLDASWLDATMPPNVSRRHWWQAVTELRPSERTLFKALYHRVLIDRGESDDPRDFDSRPYRLAATQVAIDLGRTANSVSAQWSIIQKKLRRTVSVLRLKELHAEGHSLSFLRAMLRTLKWSDADADSLIAEMDFGPSSMSGGTQ